MRKHLIAVATAFALVTAPVMIGKDQAQALDGGDILRGVIGAMVVMGVAAAISNSVQAGQQHCHPGFGCHSHGYAGPYHYHNRATIVYAQPPAPVYQAPPPPSYGGGYSQAHYGWCAAKYRSYHAPSNTFQPYGPYPRQQCISPYM